MAGYSWVLQKSGADAFVSVTHAVVEPAPSGVARMQSADEVFTLRGVSAGHVQLHFELRRSWEKDASAAQQRVFEVEVLPQEKGRAADAL